MAAANQPDFAAHGLGSNPSPGLTRGISAAAVQMAQQLTAIPASADLSKWDPPVGNQGPVGSCASWATGYYYRYWLRNHATGETSTFAPMYLYSQIVAYYDNGLDQGSSFAENFDIMESEGIPHADDYSYSDTDYSDLPTAADDAAAAPYKTTSATELYYYGYGNENQIAIESSIASSEPALLRIPLYDSFWSVSTTNPMVNVPAGGEVFHGYHAVFASKYDAQGVWIENSWGSDWGDNGWAELSWDFVNNYSTEGWNITSADATATHLSVSTYNPYVAGATHSVTVKALDANGDVATGYTGTIHFTSSDGQSTRPADYTFNTTDQGVHAFTAALVLRTAGSQWVRATDKVTASITGSQTVTVAPVKATHLSVSTFAFIAGEGHSVTVKALDAYGNPDPSYRGAIHFTSSDTKATVPADYTFTSADGGVHAFALSLNPKLVLKTAGSQWVRATDKVTASITGSQTVTVTPAKVTHLSVSTFNPYVAGATHTVMVKALDAYGNVATGYLGAIHFTSSDTRATLPADYAFKAADKGVHAFTAGIVLRTAGSQWVRATDKVAAFTGSQTVTVTPGAAKTLAVTIVSPYVLGATHTVTVKALDAYGNVATGYLGAIHFTSSDSRATLPADYTFKAADKGVHAFTAGIVLKSADDQWVRATDKTTASITGSQMVTVN